ncbi:MAG: hypothetical protein PHX52_02260 [Candidatus Pacebacteria bacterium]|nr:hypothetical protein [Candidatus Paceibacterota bacterium]
MKKTPIVLICLIAMTILVFSSGCISEENIDPTDLASPNDNALQTELQEIATEYSYMLVSNMQDMLREEKNKLSIQDDFCNDLYFSEPKWDKVNKGYYITLYSRSGYYCGPIFFFDENGVRIKTAEEVFTLSPTYGLTFNPIWANYTIVTLDKVNPKFASEVTSYWLK